MTQAYSNPERQDDPHALPDVEVFQLTAAEVVEMDQDLMEEYASFHEYRLASMNSKVREQMVDSIIAQQGITGGWYYWYCFPGCLPDSDPIGPFATEQEAIAADQEDSDDGEIGDYGVNAGSHIDPADLA